MKALVTGANGFIGSSIVRELLSDGAKVKVLIRQNSDTRNLEGLDVERCYGDIRDGESVKAALKGCDTLFQSAAIYSFWLPNSRTFYDVNVEGTKTALNAALEQNIGKVVYTSSIAAIGAHGKDPLRTRARNSTCGILLITTTDRSILRRLRCTSSLKKDYQWLL